MKYSCEEYEELIISLNLNKNRRFIYLISLVSAVVAFVVGMIIDSSFSFSVVLAVATAIGAYFSFKKSILESAKKANFLRTIKFVEQNICEDRIVEKVVRVGNVENCGEYYYRDIAFVRDDKLNFYLYLNDDTAIVVNKSKLGDVANFEKILKANNLI
jgi:hypothetical protein